MPPKTHQLEITNRAQKQIVDLQPKIQRQVRETIIRLVNTLNQGQRPQDIKPIKGEPGTYRIDSGEYRIMFHLDEPQATITIVRIRHRKDAYRGH